MDNLRLDELRLNGLKMDGLRLLDGLMQRWADAEWAVDGCG